MVKIVIFDLDDTLVDIAAPVELAQRKVAKELFSMFGIFEPTGYKLLYDVFAGKPASACHLMHPRSRKMARTSPPIVDSSGMGAPNWWL